MQFPLLPILSLAGLAIAADNSCRQYDVVFTTCLPDGKEKGFSYLADWIETGVATQIPLAADGYNSCFGGDGTKYVHEYKEMKQTDGALKSGCETGFTKYETKIKIYRWRTKWKTCADIDWYMNRAVASPSTTFWYSNPVGGHVKCYKVVPKLADPSPTGSA